MRGHVAERGVGPLFRSQTGAILADLAIGLVDGEDAQTAQRIGLLAQIAVGVVVARLQQEAGLGLRAQAILTVVGVDGRDAASVDLGQDVAFAVVGPGLVTDGGGKVGR
ncbi:MAG: hypothetical protein ABS97_00010 [Lysobacteraceae bacterium SCN 69-320]|nr:MAG: hypothetical protein ABS97_00010 [Xanthomonadaceae bacterium SCN 69-320]